MTKKTNPIKKDVVNKKNPWIPQFKPNTQAKLRLFCFPYAGGTTYIFHQWSNFLPHNIELCPVELPGRRTRFKETPYQSIDSLLDGLSTALMPYLDRPFAFFGHSMGGLVSFELTRLLRKSYNLSPKHLFISGYRAPQLPNPNPPISHLDDTDFKEELIKLGGTHPEILKNAEIMELLIPLLKADFAIVENYTYQNEPPLDIPITAFGGTIDPRASQGELEAWKSQTSANFELHMFDGGHFFIDEQKSQLLGYIAQIVGC